MCNELFIAYEKRKNYDFKSANEKHQIFSFLQTIVLIIQLQKRQNYDFKIKCQPGGWVSIHQIDLITNIYALLHHLYTYLLSYLHF